MLKSTEAVNANVRILDKYQVSPTSGYLRDFEPIDRLLLTNLFKIKDKLEKLQKALIEKAEAEDYNAVFATAQTLKYSGIKQQLEAAKKDFLEFGTIEVLRKIVEEEPFKYDSSYMNELYIFGKREDLLPKFRSSYDTVKQSDPKAAIYKKLGATIVL